MNEKLEKLNQEIEKTPDKDTESEGTDAPALHQRGNAGKPSPPPGIRDGRAGQHHLKSPVLPERHQTSCGTGSCRKLEGGRRVKFSKSELDIIYQYAAPTKAETLAGMKEIVPVIKDILTKAIVENAIRKLERIPEPECSQFIAATKARFLAERDNSIRQRLAAAKLQEPIMQGHDLSGKERFHPETRHMITLEVQKDCFVGFKGERFRFYLSDGGYRNAKHSEQDGEIKIKSHAAVVAGKLYPDKKPRQQER